ELRKLGPAEEISNDRAERLWINQLLWRHAVDIDVEQGHALFDQTLGAGKTDAALVRQQLTHRPYTTAAQMINVIKRALPSPQINQILDRCDKVLVGQDALGGINVDSQFLIKDRKSTRLNSS